MFTIYNQIEGNKRDFISERDFISFVKRIAIENCDYDYSIIGLSDAKEYIEDYCSELFLI
jgi:hypothetical protein